MSKEDKKPEQEKLEKEEVKKDETPVSKKKTSQKSTKKKTTKKSTKKSPKKKETKKSKAKKTQEAVAEQKQPIPDEQEPYVVMERFDEQQILADIDGQISQMADEMVYYFKDKNGKEVTGLSWVGTKAAGYHLRQKKVVNISQESVTFAQDPTDKDYMIFTVEAKDLISGAKAISMKRQDLFIRPKKGNPYPNPFWVEVGRSKAFRNAMQDLMPADWMAKMIKTWIDEGKVKIISAGSGGNPNSLPGQSVAKIKPVLNKVNSAKTKEVLEKAKEYVQTTDALNGQEKNFLMKVINKKSESLKK